MKKRFLNAFTLIEILAVVALIAILAAITIVAINPSRNFSDTRNTQRSADVLAILNAVSQYIYEQGHSINDFGIIRDCSSSNRTKIGDTLLGISPNLVAGDMVDISLVLVDTYIVDIPMDPTVGTKHNTGYTICSNSEGRVQIDAPNAEIGRIISVKR